jgi:uncharacterized membrane protein
MLQFPPIPTWDALHPLVIHFPIVLLIACPLFILIGAAFRNSEKGRPYFSAAVILLLLGTASLFVSVNSGEAASQLVDRQPQVEVLLKSHQALAVETRDVFVTLCLIACGVFFVPHFLGKTDTLLFSRVLPLSFLVFYAVGLIFLVNTADRGGRMVHELGVHAMISPTTEKPAASPENPIPE